MHEVPRSHYFYPYDLNGGPDPKDLGPIRTTQMLTPSADGKTLGDLQTVHHNWQDTHLAKARTKFRWIGKSIFQKEGTSSEEDEIPSVVPIKPDSVEGLRASLAGMRTQLAAAQRQDPRLREIIAAIKKEPRGEYASEHPRKDAQKLKARTYHYRLASDGVLVANISEGEPRIDRPVVPDTRYTSGNKDAPTAMTWKHLLLGSVHNTITGSHRNAMEMAAELDQLVAWWPPEFLNTDCKTWV